MLGAAALLVLALIIVVWARTRPGFDPYGWLVWGHQTIHGALDTNAAPSWKPLPYLFTVPFALFGHYELWLWMVACAAVSLGGALAAGHIVYRLTLDRAPEAFPQARYAAGFAGLVAVVGVLTLTDGGAADAGAKGAGWWHYMFSAQSDTMVLALCMGAIDMHLLKRPRWAFVLGTLAALGRPEVLPFLGLYGIWAYLRVPGMRWMVIGGLAAIIFLWLGIPGITSRSPFVAFLDAKKSGRRLRSDQVFGTVRRFLDLHQTGLEIGALASVLLAALWRDLFTLTIAAGAVVWVIIEIVLSLLGTPGLGRYMFAAGGVMVVIAGLLVGRLLVGVTVPSLRLSGTAERGWRWLGVIVALALAVGLVPTAISRARAEHRDLHSQRARTKEINRLSAVVNRYGAAAHLRRCGEPLTRLEYQTTLAWVMGVNVSAVGYKYGQAIAHGNPLVLFTPLRHGGWRVQGVHQVRGSCRRLPH